MNYRQNQEIFHTLLFIIGTTFILSSVFQYIGLGATISSLAYGSIGMLTIFSIQELILLIPLVYFLKTQNFSYQDLKLKKFNVLKSLGLIILGFFIFFAANHLILSLSDALNITLPGYGTQEQRLPLFGQDPFSMPIAILVLVFLAPLVEELVFRGFIYTKLRSNYKAATSIIVSALIFAGFHLEPEIFLPLFILGCIIGYIYEKSDSLWAPILFHVINNSIAFAAEFYLISN